MDYDDDEDDWEQMPIGSLNSRSSKSSRSVSEGDEYPDMSWQVWLCVILVEASLLLLVSKQLFSSLLDDVTKNFNGMGELDAGASFFLPVILIVLRLNLARPRHLPFVVHAGSFALTGIAVLFAVHVCGFFHAMVLSTSLSCTATLVACMECCVRKRKESRFARLLTFTMTTIVCSILSVALLTVAERGKPTKYRNHALVIFISVLLNHHVYFAAYRVRMHLVSEKKLGGSSGRRGSSSSSSLSGVATSAVVVLDITGVLYFEYMLKIFVGAVRCRNVKQIRYFPRVKGARSESLFEDGEDEDEENKDAIPTLNDSINDGRYEVDQVEKEDDDDYNDDDDDDVEANWLGGGGGGGGGGGRMISKDDSEDENNEEKEKEKKMEKIAFKDDDEDDGEEPSFMDMSSDVLAHKRRNDSIRSHDTASLWTFLDVDATADTLISLDERMNVCLYCHFSMCSTSKSALPIHQTMTLNRFRSFVNEMSAVKKNKKKKSKHGGVKPGRIDKIYSDICVSFSLFYFSSFFFFFFFFLFSFFFFSFCSFPKKEQLCTHCNCI